jgi:hypothetical protein
MANRRAHIPLDLFTNAELCAAAELSARNIQHLDACFLTPAAIPRPGVARLWDIRALKRIIIIGALRAAGIELLLAGRLCAAIADPFESRHGKLRANIDDAWRLLKIDVPEGWRDDADNDFWFHADLVRHGLPHRNHAAGGDLLLEIADRRYAFAGAFGWPELHDPLFLIKEWERGETASIVPVLDLVGEAGTPTAEANIKAWEREFASAYRDAVGLLRLNVSLAIRNGLDRIAGHRAGK